MSALRRHNPLENHPVNVARRKSGKRCANMNWPWGGGKTPVMPTFKEKYGVGSAVISAVDLVKGIGVYAGMKIVEVPGATGDEPLLRHREEEEDGGEDHRQEVDEGDLVEEARPLDELVDRRVLESEDHRVELLVLDGCLVRWVVGLRPG